MLIGVVMALICGCQTMQPVAAPTASGLRLSVTVGDTVRVLTKYGDRPTFEVTEVTQDALLGNEQNIRYDDMAFVEKRSVKAQRGNALAVILLLVGGAVIVEGLSELPPGLSGVP